MLLPRWKDQYACQIVVVPTHLLLAEEAHDLILAYRSITIQPCVGYARCWCVCDEKVVEKCRDIVEHGFGVEEELGKETEILRI